MGGEGFASVIRVVEVLTAMADHHLRKVGVPAEVNTESAVFGVLGSDLEVLPHFNGLPSVAEYAFTPRLGVAFNGLRFPGRIVAASKHLTG